MQFHPLLIFPAFGKSPKRLLVLQKRFIPWHSAFKINRIKKESKGWRNLLSRVIVKQTHWVGAFTLGTVFELPFCIWCLSPIFQFTYYIFFLLDVCHITMAFALASAYLWSLFDQNLNKLASGGLFIFFFLGSCIHKWAIKIESVQWIKLNDNKLKWVKTRLKQQTDYYFILLIFNVWASPHPSSSSFDGVIWPPPKKIQSEFSVLNAKEIATRKTYPQLFMWHRPYKVMDAGSVAHWLIADSWMGVISWYMYRGPHANRIGESGGRLSYYISTLFSYLLRALRKQLLPTDNLLLVDSGLGLDKINWKLESALERASQHSEQKLPSLPSWNDKCYCHIHKFSVVFNTLPFMLKAKTLIKQLK